MTNAAELAYALTTLLFIVGLKMLNSPDAARRGNLVSAAGMLLAVVATLVYQQILTLEWIAIGMAAGALIGVIAARTVAMTSMPEMVALLNGSGGLASVLVGWQSYGRQEAPEFHTTATLSLAILIGGVTFTGSVVAWAKLSEKISGKPLVFGGQRYLNGMLVLGAIVVGSLFILGGNGNPGLLPTLICISLLLGVSSVVPIGGADMPVVIALLNSFSGLAASATGFVLSNPMLVVAGALVGTSGLILTRIMCLAMNRSLPNVLFSGFGSVVAKTGSATEGEAKTISAPDAWIMLEAARSVVIVPGYGMAVAQAQHVARELAEILEDNGTEVRFAIHPVAGRMPGHMNVLLAEANVEYDHLVEMNAINPLMNTVDVCLVVGANDVVNPAAHDDPSSPIYGMPIIEAGQARTVIILKRSLAAGFAGIGNSLFYKPNTRLLLGDAKASLQNLVSEAKN